MTRRGGGEGQRKENSTRKSKGLVLIEGNHAEGVIPTKKVVALNTVGEKGLCSGGGKKEALKRKRESKEGKEVG